MKMQWILFYIFAVLCPGLVACGQDNTIEQTPEQTSLAFDIQMAEEFSMETYQALDCINDDVYQVRASVYNGNDELNTTGGPWDCNLHYATIDNIQSGINQKLVVQGLDTDGKIIYQGEKLGIEIIKNQTNHVGDVRMYKMGLLINEDFSQFDLGVWEEKSLNGNWMSVFNGYGENGIENNSDIFKNMLYLRPQASIAENETHSGLVISNPDMVIRDFSLSCQMQTVQQLRENHPPNPWECGWIIWRYALFNDKYHFYYLNIKPNGWEIGKLDSEHPEEQRFLKTGDTPATPVGVWQQIKVTMSGRFMSCWIGDTQIADNLEDAENPYEYGPVGFYSEDAHIIVDNVVVTNP